MRYSIQRDLLLLDRPRILLCLFDAADGAEPAKKPTRADAQAALTAVNNGEIETFFGRKICVDFSGRELDLDRFATLYGQRRTIAAVIEMQKCAVGRNTYLNDLTARAEGFFLIGRYYVIYDSFDPGYTGIYFVCGYDTAAVWDDKRDWGQLYLEQTINGLDRLDLHVEKLNGACPFASYENIIHYCQRASLVRALGNKYHFAERIDVAERFFVAALAMMCRNIADRDMSFEHREENRAALAQYFNAEGPHQIETKGRAPREVELMCLIPERRPLFQKNRVSLETLATHVFGLSDPHFLPPEETRPNQLDLGDLFVRTGSVMCLHIANDRVDALLAYDRSISATLVACGNQTFVLYDARYHEEMQIAYLRATKRLLVRLYSGHRSQPNSVFYGANYCDLELLLVTARQEGVAASVCLNSRRFSKALTPEEERTCNFIYDIIVPAQQSAALERIAAQTGVRLRKLPQTNRNQTLPRLVVCICKIEGAEALDKWLAKRPDVLYFQGKPIAAQLTGTAAETGFGGKANFFSSVFMVFDAKFQSEVEYRALRGEKPQYFRYTAADVIALAGPEGVRRFSAKTYDLVRLFQNAEKFKIPMAIDEREIYFNLLDPLTGITDNTLAVVFPGKFADTVNYFLQAIAEHDRYDYYLNLDELDKYNYNRPKK